MVELFIAVILIIIGAAFVFAAADHVPVGNAMVVKAIKFGALALGGLLIVWIALNGLSV